MRARPAIAQLAAFAAAVLVGRIYQSDRNIKQQIAKGAKKDEKINHERERRGGGTYPQLEQLRSEAAKQKTMPRCIDAKKQSLLQQLRLVQFSQNNLSETVFSPFTSHLSCKRCAFTLAEIFHPAEQSKRTAFTLAEVLITLGIIGVVAALTMPSLIAHHKRKVVETRLAKFYSTVNQAIAMSEAENGDKKDWLPLEDLSVNGTPNSGNPPLNAISAEEWFNKYLSKYLKVIKVDANKTPERKCDLYFPDGSMVTFSGSSWIFYPEARDYKISMNDELDVLDRNRKDSGKTNFTFKFWPTGINTLYYNKGVEPYASIYGENLDDNDLKQDASLGCYVANASDERAFCTELIRRNGWKIPKDYPWFK